jgi:hypothetical protein
MQRVFTILSVAVMLALTGCGPAMTYVLCQNNVLDCTNGRTAEEKK